MQFYEILKFMILFFKKISMAMLEHCIGFFFNVFLIFFTYKQKHKNVNYYCSYYQIRSYNNIKLFA